MNSVSITAPHVPVRRVGVLVVGSTLVGAMAQVADGYQPLSEAVSRGGIWFMMIVLLGVSASSVRLATASAVIFGLMSLVGYYSMTAVDTGWAPPWTTVWFWSVAALTLAPAVSVTAHWAWHGGHALAWLAYGAGGGLMLGEAVDVLLGDSSRRAASFFVAVAGGVAILAAGWRREPRGGPMLAVAIVAVPIGLLGLRLLEVVYRIVIGGGLGSWV